MTLSVFHLIFVAFVTVVFTQPSIDDPDFNSNIWRALCTGELPAPPRNHTFPLRFDIYQNPLLNTYSVNQNVRVTLRGNDPDFDFGAFLIQARSPFDTIPIGTWTAGALGRPISCSHPEFIGNNAAAQLNVTIRRYQELIWTAPSTPGNYIFDLTTSERFMVYWANQFSPLLRVV